MQATTEQRRARILSLLVVSCLLLIGALSPSSAHAVQAATNDLTIGLDAETPAIVTGESGIELRGTVHNTGTSPVAAATLHVGLRGNLLDTPGSVRTWYAGRPDLSQPVVATTDVGALAPGQKRSFTVKLPPEKLPWRYALAALPMTLTATEGKNRTDAATRGAVRTSLQMQQEGATSPIRIGWVVPLTLPADAALFGPSGAARDAAWVRAIGPGSRVDQLLTALADQPVTWVIDPALLQPALAADPNVPAEQLDDPQAAQSAETVPSDTPSTLAALVRARLASLKPDQSIWWTAHDDPDVSTLISKDQTLLKRVVARGLPATLRSLSNTRVVWPAGDLTATQAAQISKVWSGAGQPAPLTMLPRRAVTDDGAALRNSVHRTPGVGGVVLYHEALSSILSEATADPGLQASRFLAESIALYQQSPGTDRSATVVIPRQSTASPQALAATMKSIRTATWTADATGKDLADSVPKAGVSALLPKPGAGTPFPTEPASPLTKELVTTLTRQRERVTTLGSVLVDSADWVRAREQALDVVVSTRWRGAGTELFTVSTAQTDTLREMVGKVAVNPATVNFFADSGRLSVTVVNDLNRAVRGVTLTLQPRKYVLRVPTQPEPIDMRANARSNVRTEVVAIAPGQVTVDAALTAPSGAPLGEPGTVTQLKINVRPTSTWIYWVLGIVGGLVLVIGLWRSLRRGPRRSTLDPTSTEATAPDAIVDAGRSTPTSPDDGEEIPEPKASPLDDDHREH
ncbi:hypothetical protein IEE94_14245 [Yimella sp. cx-573]|nr:hypothetical protein [Yimella sp. cx-573]